MRLPKRLPRRFRNRRGESRMALARSSIPPARQRELLRLAVTAARLAREVHSTTRPSDVLLFIGRGMNPLFDAYSQLFPRLSIRDRRNVRLFLSPSVPNPKNPRDVEMVVQKLKKDKIIGSRPARFVVIDFSYFGRTFSSIQHAIRRVSPNSTVYNWLSIHPDKVAKKIRDRLWAVDEHPKAVIKSVSGDAVMPTSRHLRLEYRYLSDAIRRAVRMKEPS